MGMHHIDTQNQKPLNEKEREMQEKREQEIEEANDMGVVA